MSRHAEVVPATAEHFQSLRGSLPPRTVRAYTVVRDGQALAIAGVYRDGFNTVAFAEAIDEGRADKRSIVKLKRAVVPMFKPGTVAYADPAISGSEVLLEHLGFKEHGGRIWVW